MILRIGLLVASLLLSLLAYACLQMYVDRAGVFPHNQNKAMNRLDNAHGHFHIRPNLRIQRMRHVLSQPTQYDSFLFGSSRASAVDLTRLAGTSLDGGWYKLNYPSGMIDEHYEHLKKLLNNGVDVKQVLVNIDDFSLSLAPYNDGPYWQTKNIYEFPYLSGLKGYWFMARVFLLKPWSDRDWEILFGRYERVPLENPGLDDGVVGWENVTWPSRPHNDRVTRADHIKAMEGNNGYGTGKKASPFLEYYQSYYKKMIHLCEDNGIRCIFYLGPTHIQTFLEADIRTLYERLAPIVQWTDVYDFWGVNQYTSDPSMWNETSHHFPIVSDQVLKFLTGQNQDPEVGTLIPKRTDMNRYFADKMAFTRKQFDKHLRGVRIGEINHAFGIDRHARSRRPQLASQQEANSEKNIKLQIESGSKVAPKHGNPANKKSKTLSYDDVNKPMAPHTGWGAEGMTLFAKNEYLDIYLHRTEAIKLIEISTDNNDKYKIIGFNSTQKVYEENFGPLEPEGFGLHHFKLELPDTRSMDRIELHVLEGDDFVSMGHILVN